jgi:hypothetical protein
MNRPGFSGDRFLQVQLPSLRGRVLLHSVPGRYEPVEGFLKEGQQTAGSTMVALTPSEEVPASPDPCTPGS